MRVRSLGQKDPLEEGMTTDFSILAWRILWTEDPGGLQSMGLQRVGHDWTTNTFFLSGILALQPEIKPILPALEGKVSTTGTIGKSPHLDMLWLPFSPLDLPHKGPSLPPPPLYLPCFILLFFSLFICPYYYYFLFGYVLVVSCGIKLTRDWTWAPCTGWTPALGGPSLNHWTAREIPPFCF